jgi:hypothetical protein
VGELAAAGGDDVSGPARGGQQVARGLNVLEARASAAPDCYALAERARRRAQYGGNLTGSVVDPGLGEAGADAVRRDDAPQPRNCPTPDRGSGGREPCQEREPGQPEESSRQPDPGRRDPDAARSDNRERDLVAPSINDGKQRRLGELCE